MTMVIIDASGISFFFLICSSIKKYKSLSLFRKSQIIFLHAMKNYNIIVWSDDFYYTCLVFL
jgi:hypothetical protein